MPKYVYKPKDAYDPTDPAHAAVDQKYNKGFWQTLATPFTEKEDFWEYLNTPTTDLPSRAARKLATPLKEFGERQQSVFGKHPTLGKIAEKVGGAGEVVGDVASAMTSPATLALTATTLGSMVPAKLGYTAVARGLELPGRLASAAQVAHGGYKAATGDTGVEQAGGAAEALLGLLGARSLYKGTGAAKAATEAPEEAIKYAVKPGEKFEVVPTIRPARAVPPNVFSRGKGVTTDVLPTPRKAVVESTRGVPYGAAPTTATKKQTYEQTKEIIRDQRNLANVEKWLARQRAAGAKTAQQQLAKDKINAAIEAGELVPGKPSVGETYSAPTVEGGRVSMRVPLRAPKSAKGVAVSEDLAGAVKSEVPTIPAEVPAPTPTAPVALVAAAPQAEPTSSLAQFFKTRTGAAGKNYRLAKEAAAKGEIPSADFAREASLREQAAARAAKTAPPPPAEPAVPAAGADWQQEALQEISLLERLKNPAKSEGSATVTPSRQAPRAAGESAEDYIARLQGEKGEIGAIDLSKFGGALAGGAYGAATGDTPESRIRRALGYGFVGGMVPGAVQRVAQEGVIPAIQAGVERFPTLQRFNLLTNANMLGGGLPANVAAGPWGSGFWAGVERALDPIDPEMRAQGREVLKRLFNVKQLGSDYIENFPKARDIIGRAEGHPLGSDPSLLDRFLAAPGQAMTAGDLTIKNLLMDAGLSAEEAAEATLTSEAKLRAIKWLANVRGAGPVGETILPFSRTLGNIVEQGSMRTPFVGFVVDAYRGLPVEFQRQVLRQAIDLGIIVGSEQIGENLTPAQALMLRGVISNLGGQHALGANIGMGVGMARRLGKDWDKSLAAGATSAVGALPLPTGQPLMDLFNYGISGFDPEKVPRGLTPGVLKPGFLSDVPRVVAEPLGIKKRNPYVYRPSE